MEQRNTCGQGVAENSAHPRLAGELIAALAENLQAHIPGLDESDENARKEKAAYQALAGQLEEIAVRLGAAAERMAACRDLPMGRHDMAALTQPRVLRPFERFVRAKQELAALLDKTAGSDRELLAQMRAAIKT
jgi:hypothetical protein